LSLGCGCPYDVREAITRVDVRFRRQFAGSQPDAVIEVADRLE
jgi:hypothetical protein